MDTGMRRLWWQNWLLPNQSDHSFQVFGIALFAALLFYCGSASAFDFDDVARSFARDFRRTDAMQMRGRFESMIQGVSGMEPGRNVQIVFKSRGDVKQEYFLQDVKNQNLEDETRFESYEYLLKEFKLLDETSALKDILFDSQYDLIYGFYEPSTKNLVVMERINAIHAGNILFHELVHSAQDSTVDLNKYQDRYCRDVDSCLAASALVEGQAVSVELLVRIEQNLKGKTAREMVESVLARMDGVEGRQEAEVMDFVTGIRSFPYLYGVKFVLQKYLETGNFISMFDHVPTSTAQILHPDKPNEKPAQTVLEQNKPAISGFPGTRLLFDSTMGEYYIRRILYGGIKNGDRKRIDKAAAGWNEDTLFVLESDGKKLLVWDTQWNTEADADEFKKLYIEFTKARFSAAESPSIDSFDVVLSDGRTNVYIGKQGKRLILIEGEISAPKVKSMAPLWSSPKDLQEDAKRE